MWKDYSKSYIKNNPASGLAVVIAAFIAALLLSLLSGLFYNAWKYEVERITIEEGGWHSRITGDFTAETLEAVKRFPGIREAVINEKETRGREVVIDLVFADRDRVLRDTPKIAGLAGGSPERVSYHRSLLSLYLIRDPQDRAPRMLFPMFLLVFALSSVSLMIIIHNSFGVSMNARVRQFGIFASIGATPGQIRTCLLQEAFMLCAAPILAGNLLGIFAGGLLLQMSNVLLGRDVPGRHEAVFGYHPLVFLLTVLATILTIWISAWMPAVRLSRITPLEAVRNTEELQLKRRKRVSLLGLLFGIEGELAGNALKAQRKALRTASISLVLSFMAFAVMQCFFTLSEISTRETYFEKYQKIWDVMVRVKDTDIEDLETGEISEIPGVRSAIFYQKAEAKALISEEAISREMQKMGGFAAAPGSDVIRTEEGYLVNAPIVILDDASFLAYCQELGIEAGLDGVVIRNQIQDVTDPNFRNRRSMPYLNKEAAVSILQQAGREENRAEIPVLAYAEKAPALREEYATLDAYELVHFMPVSLWKQVKGQLGGTQEDTLLCVLGREQIPLEELEALQGEIEKAFSGKAMTESENRIQEKENNDKQIAGMKAVFGGFCVLLAVIGIGNVFSNTLGFVHQRKREFARYRSVGLTPGGIRKMFVLEALVIAGKPLLITVPLTLAVVHIMTSLSYMNPAEFWAQAPAAPILGFAAMITGFVGIAYIIGGKGILKCNLAKALRDDTLL